MLPHKPHRRVFRWVFALVALAFSNCSTPIGSPPGGQPGANESEAMLRDIARQLRPGNTVAEVFAAADDGTSRADPTVRRFQILVVCGAHELSVVADASQRYIVETIDFHNANRPNIDRQARTRQDVKQQIETLGRGCEWLSVDVGREWHFLGQLDEAGRLTDTPEPKKGPGATSSKEAPQNQAH